MNVKSLFIFCLSLLSLQIIAQDTSNKPYDFEFTDANDEKHNLSDIISTEGDVEVIFEAEWSPTIKDFSFSKDEKLVQILVFSRLPHLNRNLDGSPVENSTKDGIVVADIESVERLMKELGPEYYPHSFILNREVLKQEKQSLSQSSQITLYPNPAGEKLNLFIADCEKAEAIKRVEIFTVKGEAVYSDAITALNCELPELEISNLEEGLYILKLVSTSGTTNTTFIKL